MRRASSAGNDHAQTTPLRSARIRHQQVGRAVGADDPDFMDHSQTIEEFAGMAHGLPIAA